MTNTKTKIDSNDFFNSVNNFKNSDEFKNRISTNEQLEFLDNFWVMIDFYNKFIWWEKQNSIKKMIIFV